MQREAEKVDALRCEGFKVKEKTPSKLLVFNGNNTYSYHPPDDKEELKKANSPRGIRVRETAFTAARSKLASPEESLRNQTDKIHPHKQHSTLKESEQ